MRDPVKKRAQSLKWYRENKERANAHKKEYRRLHRDEVNAYNRAYTAANPEIRRKAARQDYTKFSVLKSTAKTRGLPCDLTLEQYRGLVTGCVCAYCGGALPEFGHGLDRKDSKSGYSTKNCVPCCRVCNSIRGKDLITYEEMFVVADVLKKLRSQNSHVAKFSSPLCTQHCVPDCQWCRATGGDGYEKRP